MSTLLLALVISTLAVSTVNLTTLTTWFAIVCVVTLCRLVLRTAYFRSNPSQAHTSRWRTAFFLGAVAAGFAWGLTEIMLAPALPEQEALLLRLILGGVAATALASMAPWRAAFTGFITPLLGSIIVPTLWSDNSVAALTVSVTVLFGVTLWVLAGTLSQNIEDSLRLRSVNLELIGQLHRSRSELATANDHLSEALRFATDSTQAKSRFLATMSHEIRTPLNGVIGMTNLLLETRLNREQREYADTVCRSGENLLSLINDILDYSKIEAGKVELEAVDFEVETAIEDVLEILAEAARNKDAELIFAPAPDLPQWLRGDVGRLRQILTNLVGNAIKFTTQGEVVVTAWLLTQQAHHVDVCFEVRDTGIGIARDAQQHIFESFRQADSVATRGYRGTGLGLAISRQLVELMGGQIEVQSELGKGSTFTFSIRLERPRQPTSSPRPLAIKLSGERVLYITDNDTHRGIQEQKLATQGMVVQTASNGPQALDMLLNAPYPFALAVLNFHRPDVEGLAAAELIRRHAKLAPLGILQLSYVGFGGKRETAAAAGINSFLMKPVRQTRLFQELADLLDRMRNEPLRSAINDDLAAEARALRSLPQWSARILLAEDNAVNQRVAARMLGKYGLQVDVTEDGAQTVSACEKVQYDLILMDCHMPIMDGFKATAILRKRENNSDRHLPIIALTASAMQGDKECCLAAGMDGYLTKPIRRPDLVPILTTWLGEPRNPKESRKSA